MTEKTASKHLIHLQSLFAADNFVLQNAAKVFHELDQFEYDLDLLKSEDTTAIHTSWWPIVSIIGGNSDIKKHFLEHFLGAQLPTTHKITVFAQGAQASQTILPATALDVDYRYPFYRISQKIEQVQKGEGERINTYLELKTLNSATLQGKLLIDIPSFIHSTNADVTQLLTTYSIEQSDVILVFCDVFNSTSLLVNQFIATLIAQQENKKIVYLFDDTTASVTSTQAKLANLGLTVGQFIGSSQLNNAYSAEYIQLDQQLANAAHQRSYRVLHALEKSILDVENVVIYEIKKAIFVWKERSTFSSLIILGAISTVAVFLEIGMGLLEFLIDPIIGPAILLSLIAIMVPTHVFFSKVQAKFIVSSLNRRQKQLHLTEDLATLFEKNLTFSRMMLPIRDPLGWNKKTKAQLTTLLDKTKDLVQSLNDSFSIYNMPVAPISRPVAAAPQIQPAAPVAASVIAQPAPMIIPEAIQVQAAPVAPQPAPVVIPEPVQVQAAPVAP
ncbi:MAG: hypothetical protein QG557_579, partial [Pseudomonadota bacterium]|nr:hypothetical protein [Pseudomonadota bacterium]